MKRPARLLLAVLAPGLLASCGPEVTSIANLCPMLSIDETLPAPSLSPTGTWDVTYTATVANGPDVASLEYVDATGALVTVTRPTFPFTYTMTGKAPGTIVHFSANATVDPGLVTLQLTAVSNAGGGTQTFARTSACGQ